MSDETTIETPEPAENAQPMYEWCVKLANGGHAYIKASDMQNDLCGSLIFVHRGDPGAETIFAPGQWLWVYPNDGRSIISWAKPEPKTIEIETVAKPKAKKRRR